MYGFDVRSILIVIFLGAIRQSLTNKELSQCYAVDNYNYSFYTNGTELEFGDATSFCTSRNSTLPTITNANIQNVFLQFINYLKGKGVIGDNRNNGNVWLGARSLDGIEQLNSTPWQWVDGRPSNAVKSDFLNAQDANWCSSIAKNGVTLYQNYWNDHRNYICEYYNDTKCDDGFELNSKCYKTYKNETVRWFTAVNRCLSSGGQLASFENHQQQHIPLEHITDSTWIGLMKPAWFWQWTSEPVLYNNFYAEYGDGDPNPPASPRIDAVIQGHRYTAADIDGIWRVSGLGSPHLVVCQTVTAETTTPIPTTTEAVTTTTSLTTDANPASTDGQEGNPMFVIALAVGIVVGFIVLTVIVVVFVIVVLRKRNQNILRNESTSSNGRDVSLYPVDNVRENDVTSGQEVVYAHIVPAKDDATAENGGDADNTSSSTGPKDVIYAELMSVD